MTKGTFIGMSRATPEKFQFSIKVPETITHVKRLDVNKGALKYFEEFRTPPMRRVLLLLQQLHYLEQSFVLMSCISSIRIL
jgi:uncharacterized protein YecE (DUF72 family)